LRSDLSRLTLLRWSDVLSNLHLLRPKRAWCPICYEERKIAGQIVYEPLIWCINAVTACVVHRRRLQTTCHFCNRQSYALASKSRPGFCSACGKWLGRSSTLPFSADEALPDSEFEWQASVLGNLGDLLSTAPDLKYLPTKEASTRSLDVCIERVFEGSATILSRNARVPKQTISNWRAGIRPRLDALLRICFHSKVSLLSFLFETIPPLPFDGEPQGSSKVTKKPDTKAYPPPRKLDLKESERILRGALTKEPPPTLVEVAKNMGRRHRTLTYHFPRAV
jgi:hypothetical protein